MGKVPLFSPDVTAGDAEFVSEVVSQGQVSGRAEVVGEFERSFAKYLGIRQAVACSNGTAALHLALRALDLGPGDEVILPALTMISPVFATLYVGATPRLVDVRRDSWVMDPRLVEETITEKTKAIVAVHTYGNPVDMDALVKVADGRGVRVVEDCAEALGASIADRNVGTFGDVATFSFYANKLITTGEGGMVVTRDHEIAERVRSLADMRFGKASKFLHEDIGFNYRLSALQAALGLSQLRRIDRHRARARGIAETYRKLLRDLEGVELHRDPPWGRTSFWMFSAVIARGKAPITRDAVMTELEAKGIETRPFFVPPHLQTFLRDSYSDVEFPVSEFLASRGLNLPSGFGLEEPELAYVAASLEEALGLPTK